MERVAERVALVRPPGSRSSRVGPGPTESGERYIECEIVRVVL